MKEHLEAEVALIGRRVRVEASRVWLGLLARPIEHVVVCRPEVLQVVVGRRLPRERDTCKKKLKKLKKMGEKTPP